MTKIISACLFLGACVPATGPAIVATAQAVECTRLQEARKRVEAVKSKLTVADIDRLFILNEVGRGFCTSTIDDVIIEMNSIARARQ